MLTSVVETDHVIVEFLKDEVVSNAVFPGTGPSVPVHVDDDRVSAAQRLPVPIPAIKKHRIHMLNSVPETFQVLRKQRKLVAASKYS